MPRLSLVAAVAAVMVAGAAASQTPQFRSAAHVVQLNVAVQAADGRPVTDLVAADFLVADNGISQRVTSVVRDTVPLDVTIVFDTSRRSPGLRTLDHVLTRVRQWLRPTDRLSLLTFNERVHEHLTRVAPGAIVMPALDPPAGTAALNDAIAHVLRSAPVEGRRQLAVVLTNSLDGSSRVPQTDVLALTRQSDVTLFSVSPSRVDPRTNAVEQSLTADASQSPVPFLQQAASLTGGVAYVLPDSTYSTYGPTQVQAHANVDVFTAPLMKALDEFRSGYVLSYTPEAATAGWHNVSVTITRPDGRYVVRTRRGYLVE